MIPPTKKILLKWQKVLNKNLCVHLDILFLGANFHENPTFFVSRVMKTKNDTLASDFVFLHKTQNIIIFRKRLCEHIEYRDRCTKIVVRIFWCLELCLKHISKTIGVCSKCQNASSQSKHFLLRIFFFLGWFQFMKSPSFMFLFGSHELLKSKSNHNRII
jgi:hypothetical protein